MKEAEDKLTTHHYQRLQRAEESWLKLREAMLWTTLLNQGSLLQKKCFFFFYCDSVANCRCLDCSPLMSLCEACAVDNHTNRNVFHYVEILGVSVYNTYSYINFSELMPNSFYEICMRGILADVCSSVCKCCT